VQPRDDARFKFVAAAHHFIADAIPFRDGASHAALGTFLKSAESAHLATPELDAVLLRTLAILDRHTAGRLPTMVEHYLSAALARSTVLKRFQECVEDVLRYRGIGSRVVQRAIAVIERQYSDSILSAKVISDALSMTPERLAAAFTAQTGMNTAKYLRNFRLDRAVALLQSSDKSVKEVWAAVGYNHASNFDHDFRDRFGQSPRQFRTRGVFAHSDRPVADHLPPAAISGRVSDDARTILIIDDDRGSRETIGRYLDLEGYRVTSVENGAEGLIEAEHHKPDAVLLDYHLPDIDGLEWLRRFRSRRPKTRVVMFSADWDLEGKLDELTALDATFLSKLCDLEDVRDALEGGRSRPTRL